MQAPLFRLVLLIGVAILLLVAGVASARERGGSAPARSMAMRQMPRQVPPNRNEAQRPPEVQPNNAARPGAPPPGANRDESAVGSSQQRAGRLTPDERKALRRQIDEARDVYRPYTPGRP